MGALDFPLPWGEGVICHLIFVFHCFSKTAAQPKEDMLTHIKSRLKMTRIFFVVIIGLFLIPMIWNDPGEAAEPIRMKFSSYTGPAHITTPIFQAYIKELNAASNGTVIIEYYGAETLGKAVEHWDLVIDGLADMAIMSCAYTPARFPLNSFVDLPFLSTNAMTSYEVVQSLLEKKLITKEFEEVKLLTHAVTSPMQIFSKRPLNKMEDFKGLRILCVGPNYNKIMGELGAQCVTMGMPDVYLALERGTLDASITNWAAVKSWKLMEVVNYPVDISITGGFNHGIIMNKKSWGKLSPQVQAAWSKISEKYGTVLSRAFDDADEGSKKIWADVNKKIIKFPDAEKEKIARLAIPIWQNWIDQMEKAGKPGKEIYRTYLKAMKEKGHPVVIKIPGI
jgi:TRAP-type transport system periplasmic protein